ncbi:hypothetical protein Afil01_45450 [Actinorhabdospora filicis]|uniref:Uncharacterized protein n=1 Tax=Actinorhabdospora filicis TaxID=1785913 RepID=A0A9W6SPH4_9ACTN|nr:hypothetical protein [Actinorhabdospora filicis]GLZ79738.1 hypothetical protein Afil01_45450 [Actinorhabdospora filicis]
MGDENGDIPGGQGSDGHGPDRHDDFPDDGRRVKRQLKQWWQATPWWAMALLVVLVVLCCLRGFSRAFG